MDFSLTDIDLRPYQTRAYEWALSNQAGVVCLPTGTGKTIVGCAWARDLLNSGTADRIVVLEPSRFLVEQVCHYYQQHTDIPTTKLDGTTPPRQRQDAWDRGRIVVTTPQTALNDAVHSQFDAVIVDECHHTTGQHAFKQLLTRVTVPYKLGLTATIPTDKAHEIEAAIGPIRRRSWTDLPDEHVPEWIGKIYDTPYPEAYHAVVEELEAARREYGGTQLAGLPTMGIRMLCRDGALALTETLTSDTKMGDLLYGRVASDLQSCAPLHKLSACRQALDDHDFKKAVIFVDRVAVATRLAAALSDYETVTLLGRLHTSRRAQEAVVAKAKSDDVDLIIATAAGEEGIDLPAADLLVVWSNVVSSVRFIQRLGRIMRPSGSDAPRVAVYLATPDSPDYEALRRGLAEAESAGLDIVHIDTDMILSRSSVGRVQDVLAGTPTQRATVAKTLAQPPSKVDEWLRTTVREGDICYLYQVPTDLNEWRQATRGFFGCFGDDGADGDDTQTGLAADSIRNNFSPTKEHRYYLREGDISIIEAEYPTLIEGTKSHRLSINYGPSHQAQSAHTTVGSVESACDEMQHSLAEADSFYANVSYDSYTPSFSFQMVYQGSASGPIINAALSNADAVATTLEDRLE